MDQRFLYAINSDKGDVGERLFNILRPELNFVCSNSIRACILHLMIKSKDLNHTMQVEKIAQKIGKRHSVIIYHLEQLEKWKLVEVIRCFKYGNKNRRSIWGLNLKFSNLINEVYNRMIRLFYTQQELDGMCSTNKNVRNNGSKSD